MEVSVYQDRTSRGVLPAVIEALQEFAEDAIQKQLTLRQ